MRRKRTLWVIPCFLLFLESQVVYGFSVSTSSQWATEAAIDVLKKGGNATDAMVAASFVISVTHPYKMGIGGGGFWLAHYKGKSYFWDHREMAPASATSNMFLTQDGKMMKHYPNAVTNPRSVGVPGTVLGIFEAHKKLGKLPWKRLLQPAIRLAKKGFPISRKFEHELKIHWPRLLKFSESKKVFGDGEGSYLKSGRVLKQPDLAKTLSHIANHGAKSFYEGSFAKKWLASAQSLGIKITSQDLKSYKVRFKQPAHFKFHGFDGYVPTEPSSASLTVAATIRYLEHFYSTLDKKEKSKITPDSAERVVITTEAIRRFQKLRNNRIADAGFSKHNPALFFKKEEKKEWASLDAKIKAKLDELKKIDSQSLKKAETEKLEKEAEDHLQTSGVFQNDNMFSHTTHLGIIDDTGMSVSYTTTIEAFFGSAMVVPGFGFLLNNELTDFNFDPNDINAPAPKKRPRSNMSPTILMAGNKPIGVVGCAGGPRIPTTVVEILENYFIHRMSAREATAFPRVHVRPPQNGNRIEVEHGYPLKTFARLRAAGYEIVRVDEFFSVAQAILRRNPKAKWEAAAAL